MHVEDKKLKEILLSENYISDDDAIRAEESAKKNRSTFRDYLLSEGIITVELLEQAVAESFGLPFADLKKNVPSKDQILMIPEEAARRLRVVVCSENKKTLTIATDDPTKENLLAELKKLFPDRSPKLAYASTEDIDLSLTQYKQSLDTRFSKIINEKSRVAPEIINQILSDARVFRASDVHFEPQGDSITIRFRIDGVLHEAGVLPRQYYENILNRIKVQSGIRLDEHYSAQDGSMKYEENGQITDLRVSIAPTVEGEKVVLRLLASYSQGLVLSDLGLSPDYQTMIEKSADKPFGMILSAGPTGSGKTTSLYALLKLLNNSDVNITTIEDPVEYKMRGVNQIQVNPLADLTFAKGLRSIVRQDPDIILVGEIRDRETAEIAVNAALTGHMLLSTFHANDAATVIPRLLDMGIEPFLLASTLEIVLAQRLARKICQQCKHSVTVEKADLTKLNSALNSFFPEAKYTLYKGKGCDICGKTGFNGRTAIFEIIRITPELQELILRRPSAQEIWRLARSQGAKTLFEDGVEKVKQGVTTIDELLRVAEPPETMIYENKEGKNKRQN